MKNFELTLNKLADGWRKNGLKEETINEKIDKIKTNITDSVERDVITMFLFEDMKTKEIAEKMHMPRNEIVDMVRHMTTL